MSHNKFFGICENKCLVEINAESVGAAAADHTHDAGTITGAVPVEKGGTGATTAAEALANLGAAAADHTHEFNVDVTATVAIANGGTGATTAKGALLNLGLTEGTTKIFSGNSEQSYIINVLTYAESKISLKSGVFMFNAQWEGQGYGTALAWQSSDYIKALLLYNATFGVRFYIWTIANSWQQVEFADPAS